MSGTSLNRQVRVQMLRARYKRSPYPRPFQIVSTAALGLFVAVIISVFLAGTEAVAEGFVVSHEGATIQPTAIFLCSLVYVVTSWLFTRLLILLVWPRWLQSGRLVCFLGKRLPRIVAALPLFALAHGLHSNGSPRFATLYSLVGLALLVWPQRMATRWTLLVATSHESNRHSARRARTRWILIPMRLRIVTGCLSLLGFLSFLVLAPSRVGWTSSLGPAALILIWGAALIAALSPLAYLSRMFRVPVFLPMVLAALVFSLFDLNDNHEIRLTHLKPGSVASPQLNFFGWLKSRPDFNQYDEYPVFLVSTEGGGLRAGYFTAMVLSALQDQNPAFAQHVYAISGVSGGSLGAAVFGSLVADHTTCSAGRPCVLEVPTRSEYQDRAEAMLSHDFLSPLLASLLFPDLLQRFLPFSVPTYDRARALEYSFEGAWRQATPVLCGKCDRERFSEDIRKLRNDPTTALSPALFLNTTGVEDGLVHTITDVPIFYMDPSAQRNQFVYLDHRFDPLRPLPEFTYYFRDPVTLPLSTAVALSARFPLVTPAGSITMNGRKRRYVDGGYFENSGTATLVELLTLLQSLRAAKSEMLDDDSSDIDRRAAKFRTFVLVISANTCLDEPDRDGAQRCEEGDLGAAEGHGFGETLSPIRTLLNTRSARAGISRRQLEWYIGALKQTSAEQARPDRGETAARIGDNSVVEIAEFQLRRRDVRLPLSWLLSKSAREDIKAQVAETRADRLGALTEKTNLQPDNPSNKKAFEAVVRVLNSNKAPKAGDSDRNVPP
ncbi:MAG: hypothetical protein JWN45_313 [Acidobacteriaceae bacterium]|nr:hypothetical protein [Acidobacteriaceae bacterium]